MGGVIESEPYHVVPVGGQVRGCVCGTPTSNADTIARNAFTANSAKTTYDAGISVRNVTTLNPANPFLTS